VEPTGQRGSCTGSGRDGRGGGHIDSPPPCSTHGAALCAVCVPPMTILLLAQPIDITDFSAGLFGLFVAIPSRDSRMHRKPACADAFIGFYRLDHVSFAFQTTLSSPFMRPPTVRCLFHVGIAWMLSISKASLISKIFVSFGGPICCCFYQSCGDVACHLRICAEMSFIFLYM